MATSRVVVVRAAGARATSGALERPVISRMFRRGLALISGESDEARAVRFFFRLGDRIGIKVNTIGGKALSTGPDVALPLVECLARGGMPAEDMIIWDRTNREIRDAGYTLSPRRGPRVFGTDTDGVGYGPDLVSHLNVGSLFSRIQTDLVSASVSLAVLKDHGLAGITAGMKNYFGAVHNPNKYHDSRCDPFVAEVFDAAPVKSKHRITILDALVVQCHRGPSYHARWAEPFRGLVFSTDPVAADSVGRAIVDRIRAAKGLPSLEEEGREPLYLATAQRMGLGRADPAGIETIEETVR